MLLNLVLSFWCPPVSIDPAIAVSWGLLQACLGREDLSFIDATHILNSELTNAFFITNFAPFKKNNQAFQQCKIYCQKHCYSKEIIKPNTILLTFCAKFIYPSIFFLLIRSWVTTAVG